MAQKTVSKTNVTARKTAGWQCPDCRHNSGELDLVCRGSMSSRLLTPNAKGRGLRSRMHREKCQRRKP